MYIQVQYRKLSLLTENYQMSLTHRVWVSWSIHFDARIQTTHSSFAIKIPNLNTCASKGVVIRFQVFACKLVNIVESSAVIIRR